MELFSKRYQKNNFRVRSFHRRDEDDDNFLGNLVRTRLQEEVSYLISSEYVEPFMLVSNKRREEIYLHDKTLRELSMRELGYDLTKIINCDDLDFDMPEYNDYNFFDLVELVVIFALEEKRDSVIERLSSILDQEGDEFTMNSYMVFSKNSTGLRSILPLIKDSELKKMLEDYFSLRSDFNSRARVSAQILQRIFSSPDGQSDTKKHSEELCKEVASKWTTKGKAKKLAELINDAVKHSKALSNQIANIRHTDRHTIPVDHPDFYKMITTQNSGIIELVLLSLPEKYISTNDPRELKQEYLKKYDVNPNSQWVVKPKESGSLDLDDIGPDDIPF